MSDITQAFIVGLIHHTELAKQEWMVSQEIFLPQDSRFIGLHTLMLPSGEGIEHPGDCLYSLRWSCSQIFLTPSGARHMT